jgi:hypothetical protein
MEIIIANFGNNILGTQKNGVSSYEIPHAISVTQKTAWFMLARIRVAIQAGTIEKLEFTVEADEMFIGGKGKNIHKDKKAEKIQGRSTVGKVGKPLQELTPKTARK